MRWQDVVELRQYTVREGKRDTLIDLFDTHFLAGQEVHPMRVVGQFRDRDAENRFVWFRDFAGMAERHEALAGFYGGAVWREHRETANGTMIDSDDVLLLRPIHRDAARPEATAGLVVVTVYPVRAPIGRECVSAFADHADPLLARLGAPAIGLLHTEPAHNTFPALPVREDVRVVVRVTRFDDDAAYTSFRERLHASQPWNERIRPLLDSHLAGRPTTMRLDPTARSRLR